MGPPSRHRPAEFILLLAVCISGVHVARAAAIDSELRSLRCFLLSSQVQCSEIPVVPELPERLQKMYLNLSDITKQAISAGMLKILKPKMIAELPAFFINLIPMTKLSSLDGSSIGAIIKKDPGNLAVVRKLSTLLSRHKMWTAFIDQMKNVTLPTASQEILGEMLSLFLPHPSNWTFYRFNETLSVGTPLMAHLPPEFLYNLHPSEVPKFLFHLRSWYWHFSGLENPWHKNSWSVLRHWAKLAVEVNYPSRLSDWTIQDVTSNSFFLDGAMPDELEELATWQLSKDTVSVNWSRLQARVLFNKMFSSSLLTEQQSLKALPLVPKLAPTDLQRFNLNATNFKLLTFTNEMSYITAKQVAEALIAQSVVMGDMPSDDPALWKESIRSLGSFVFTLPPHNLKPYQTYPLHRVLSDINSVQLTATQARYLTANGSLINLMVPETVLSLSGNLLHTLDSKSVALARVGEMSHRMRLHLLSSIPPSAPVRSIAVLQKVRNSIGDATVLESMLSNSNPEQFFSLLLPREVAHAAGQISQALLELSRKYAPSIKSLPHNVLSTLLEVERRKLERNGEGWTEDTLLKLPSSLFLLGLTCSDVNAIESTDVVAIFERYNRERTAVGQEFPKHLQYCAQSAVIRYLQTKAMLNGVGYSGAKLLDHLDASEIMAIGGYVFTSLPVKVLSQVHHSKTMLQAIGALSLPELLVATNGNAGEIAKHFVKELTGAEGSKLMLADLLKLGNLIHLLRASDVEKVDPNAFRQLLELQDCQAMWRTMCSSLDSRTAWARVIEAAFGSVENWTAGVLVILGDLLAVLPPEKLDRISHSSWQAAADTLVNNTKYHVQMQWHGELEPFMLMQVCGRLTDETYPDTVRGLARHYLLAVQSLLQTVSSAGQLLRYMTRSSSKLELELAPLNNPVATSRKVVNQIESADTGFENDATETDENTIMATPAELMATSFKRLRRDFERTNSEKQQYGDVLRSKVTSSHGDKNQSVPVATPSDKTIYSEVQSTSMKVSCDAVRACGPVAGLGMRITDVENMSPQELEDCLDVLGSLSLSAALKQQVWTRIRQNNLTIHLADLGSLLSEVSAEDLEHVNLDQKEAGALDTLAALSATVTSAEVLEKIVQLFSDANFRSPHPSLGVETMMALGKVACMLPVTFLRHIAHSKEIFYASAALAHINTCDRMCLRELVLHMMDKHALGPIVNWTSEDVKSLGVLAAAIPAESWSQVKSKGSDNPLIGLQPSAVKCMETHTMRAFNTDQLESLSPVTVAAITPEQMAVLSESQRFTLKQTHTMDPRNLDLVIGQVSASSSASPQLYAVLAIIAVIILT